MAGPYLPYRYSNMAVVTGIRSCQARFGETGLEMIDQLNAAFSERYTVQRELGRGGMATVYLADDPKHGRQVAIKVLHPELAAVIGAERFLKEIEIAAGLTHPHILPLHDSGEADGLLYYVMPYVEGESLRDRLDRETQLSIEDTTRIASEVADALSYARTRCRTRTPGTWCTATSSRRISCYRAAMPWWPTSGSHGPSTRPAERG